MRRSEAKPRRAGVEAPDVELRVAELWRYPVKGLRGERLDRLTVEADGVPGDRSLAVLDERGIVTGRRRQRMIGVQAGLGEDGEPLIGGRRWDSADSAATIAEVAGAGARLVRPASGHEYDAAPILLLSDGSVDRLGYDRRRFRPNIYVEGADGPVEQGWAGSRVRVGDVLLDVREPCERCVITTIDPDTIEVDLDVLKRVRSELGGAMGVYCDVVDPGTVRVGDPVAVV